MIIPLTVNPLPLTLPLPTTSECCKRRSIEMWISEPTGDLAFNERLLAHIHPAPAPAERLRTSRDTHSFNALLDTVEAEADAAAGKALGLALKRLARSISTLRPIHPLDALALRAPIHPNLALRSRVADWVEARLQHYAAQPAALAEARASHWDDQKVEAIRIRSRLRSSTALAATLRAVVYDDIAARCERLEINPALDRWIAYKNRCAAVTRLARSPDLNLHVPDEIARVADGEIYAHLAGHQAAARSAAIVFSEALAHGGADEIVERLSEFEALVADWIQG